jgi:transcriptional regulator with XRE-family HTH domain
MCGENVRRLRELAELSQEQIAAKVQCEGLNLTQKTISRIELGDRVVADFELAALAKVFCVTVPELLVATELMTAAQ